MSAPDDRQTHSASARGRRRSSRGCDLDWGPRQARDFLPAGRDRTLGKLHPRRIRRGIKVAGITDAEPRSPIAAITSTWFCPSTIVLTTLLVHVDQSGDISRFF